MSDLLPPFDAAAEAGALGCVLQADGEAASLLDRLTLDDFYDERHRAVYRVARLLRLDDKPINVVTLAQRLRDLGKETDAGGLAYFGALPDQTPSPANFPTFLETLQDRTARRMALRDANELETVARNLALPQGAIGDAARRVLEAHAKQNCSEAGLTVRTPAELLAMRFDDSDIILGDRVLATGQSLVISGQGSIGKSRLALQLMVAIIAGKPFVSLETRGQHLRGLILQAENSNRRISEDLRAVRQWVGSEAWARVEAQLFIHTLESDADGFLSLGDLGAQRRIAGAIEACQPDIVLWDSLYNFAIGDLNADHDMSETLLTLSRIAKAGNPQRAIVVLHHALTGKAGAARAHGYDRASFGRNSKVLHSWTRGQINVAPGSPDSNEVLVITCGKCSNGKEFSPFAARLNSDLIYEPDPDFDFSAWEADVSGKSQHEPTITTEGVRELCKGSMSKRDLARAIMTPDA